MNVIHCVTRAAILFVTVGIAACSEPPPEAPERIRAIKPYYVAELAGGDVRLFSGTIVASDTSALSFAVSGTVATVMVNQGDRVTAGQILATLDSERYDLNLQATQSQLTAAQANLAQKETALDRQSQLFERGWVTKAALDQAKAAYEAAEADVNLARSRLGTAERDVAKTSLTAPFDGLLARRDVEPFEEVSIGQALFLINSEGALEVDLSVPDTIVLRLAIGAPVIVNVSAVPTCGCAGRLTEIGIASGSANAVSAKVALLDRQPDLLPGMSAEVSVMLSGGAEARGFLVPLAAIAPGDENAPGYLFKYDSDANVVRRVPIQVGESVVGNFVEIVEGVEAGDIVAAAGVGFLRDGQPVKLSNQ